MTDLLDPAFADEWIRHLLRVEDTIFVLARPFGVPSYDFNFERSFACTHPVYLPESVEVVARVGPIADYEAVFAMFERIGLRLVNDPAASFRANDVRGWYPLITDLTARSLWFEGEPDIDRVTREIGFPVFVKTVQQTLRHRRDVSIVADRAALERSVAVYRSDPVLGAHPLVFREYLELAPLPSASAHAERIPGGREIRSFWWKGRVVGDGPYWSRDGGWTPSPVDQMQALALAEEAARRLDVPFLVIDAAQRIDGSWVIIEANDAQESGYTGVSPVTLWRAIIEADRAERSTR
jgi:hypothetical protein